MNIILKNTTGSKLTLNDLGVTLESNDVSELDPSELDAISVDEDLKSYIQSGSIVVNNGAEDLSISEAIDYLTSKPDLSNYYTKTESNALLNSKANISHTHNSLYYQKSEVDDLVSNSSSYGIKGAVDFIEQLPETGSEGEIWIVRGTSGDGDNLTQYQVNNNTILFVKFDNSYEDEVGNWYESYNETYVDGRFGKSALIGNGKGTARYRQTLKAFNPPELSGGIWVYADVNHFDRYNPIIHMWNKDDEEGIYLLIKDGKPKLYIGTDEGDEDKHSSTHIGKHVWTHIGFTFSKYNERLRIYINGLLDTEKEDDDLEESIKLPTDDLWIGYNPEEGHETQDNFLFDEFFLQEGELDEQGFQNIINGSPYQTLREEGFYTWETTTSSWEWLANNTTASETLGSSPISQGEGDELTSGEDINLHKHDNRYYTETEIDSKLADKADTNHTHSDYYTKTQVDNIIDSIDYNKISNNDSSTNITGAELEQLTNGSNADGLHTHSGGSGSGSGGLDDAYDNHSEWSHGSGREIEVDFGPVTLDAKDGFAPFYIKEIDYAPNKWLSTGHMCVYDGELFIYDATRSCWNSMSGYHIGGGFNSNNVKNTYLKGFNGTSFTDDVGWVAPWDGVVVSMAGSSNDDTNQAVELRKNGNSTSAKIWYDGNKKVWANWIDVKFSEGDVLNFYATEWEKDLNRPQVWAIIKRRIS